MRNDGGSMMEAWLHLVWNDVSVLLAHGHLAEGLLVPILRHHDVIPVWIRAEYRGWDLSLWFWINHDIVNRIIMTSKYEELKYVHDPWSKHLGSPWSWNHVIVNGITVIQKYKEYKDVNSSTLVHIGNDIKIQGIKRYQSSTLVHRPREVWCQVVERSGKLQVSCTWEPLRGKTLWCFTIWSPNSGPLRPLGPYWDHWEVKHGCTWPWDIKYGCTWLAVLKEGSNRGVDKQNHGWVLFSNDNFPTHLARDSGSLIFIRLTTISGPASSKFLSSQTWWLS